MAIGINLGDDESRTQEQVEFISLDNQRLEEEAKEFRQAFELVRAALEVTLPVGRSVIIDGRKLREVKAYGLFSTRLVDHDWFLLKSTPKGIVPYPITNNKGTLRHGMIIEPCGIPGKVRVVR